MTHNKRLEMLEKMTASPSADAFTWYALSMERRNSGDDAGALLAFEQLNSKFPDYLPQYLMAGQLLLRLERKAEAANWLERGIELARTTGNDKALSELSSALDECS